MIEVIVKVNNVDVAFDMVQGRAKVYSPIFPGQRVYYCIRHYGGFYAKHFTAERVMEYVW